MVFQHPHAYWCVFESNKLLLFPLPRSLQSEVVDELVQSATSLTLMTFRSTTSASGSAGTESITVQGLIQSISSSQQVEVLISC